MLALDPGWRPDCNSYQFSWPHVDTREVVRGSIESSPGKWGACPGRSYVRTMAPFRCDAWLVMLPIAYSIDKSIMAPPVTAHASLFEFGSIWWRWEESPFPTPPSVFDSIDVLVLGCLTDTTYNYRIACQQPALMEASLRTHRVRMSILQVVGYGLCEMRWCLPSKHRWTVLEHVLEFGKESMFSNRSHRRCVYIWGQATAWDANSLHAGMHTSSFAAIEGVTSRGKIPILFTHSCFRCRWCADSTLGCGPCSDDGYLLPRGERCQASCWGIQRECSAQGDEICAAEYPVPISRGVTVNAF